MTQQVSDPKAEKVQFGSTKEPVTLDLNSFQQLYHELTGKSETLSKQYFGDFLIEFQHLSHLNEVLRQMLAQFQVKAITCSVTHYFCDKTKQEHSSFDIFSTMAAASVTATESIHIQYEFVIIHPQTNRPQNYEVSIRIRSRVGEEMTIRDLTEPERRLRRYFDRSVALVHITYIDYTVARVVLDTMDRCTSVWPKTVPNKICAYVQKNVRVVSPIFPYLVGILAGIGAWTAADAFLVSGSTLGTLAKFLILSAGSIYILYDVGRRIARALRMLIEDYRPISYVAITKGDERCIEDAKERRKKSAYKIGGSLLITLLECLLANVIVKLILAQTMPKVG